jgi:hypothetical protein
MYTIGGIRGPPSASENASDAAPKPLRAGHSRDPAIAHVHLHPVGATRCRPWVVLQRSRHRLVLVLTSGLARSAELVLLGPCQLRPAAPAVKVV